MITYSKVVTTLLVILLSVMLPPANAQTTAKVLTQEQKSELSALLSQVCDVDGQQQWKEALAEYGGPNVETFALHILVRGAPEEQKQRARAAAQNRYGLRAERLAKNTDKLFDAETTKRLQSVDKDSYIAASVRLIDLVYRENALRALGLFGTKNAIPTITAAAQATPSLQLLSRETIAAIQAR